jgi:P-type Cu+ transporter
VTTELLIDGMTCGNCAQNVTRAIQSVPEVRSAAVSLQSKNAVVNWNTAKNLPAVLQAVKDAGFEAREMDALAHSRAHANWQLGLWLGILVTAFLMIGEWIFPWQTAPWFLWTSFALAGFIQIFSGAQFYRGAWRQLKSGSSNMDTLVALGSTTAYGYSAWALFSGAGGHVYFMEAAAIITLISLGHWIEAHVSDKASGALKSLLHLAPQTARKASQPAQDVPVSELQIGDEILLRPGDHVPVDGIIIEGESTIDESMLTGESVPVDKKTGGEVFAGTVNINGRLVMRATATGEETALARVIAAVQYAQTSRADIQRLGDRVSSVFVPIVVIIAIAAGLWWGIAPQSAASAHDTLTHFLWHAHIPVGSAAGFMIAASILIIACPCAMGLATPVAIMAGANAAARRGILIRDGIALEKAGNISALVFDKTGTLTIGKPEVADVREIQGSACNIQSLAASLAQGSSHPISRAIAKISSEKVELTNWQEIPGAGIEATIPLGKIRLGSLLWLRENLVYLSQGDKFILECSARGSTVVGLAAEKMLLGLFEVRDAVQPNAEAVIRQLRQQGLKIFLVTGDNSRTAASIARQAGIAEENVLAEVRPDQKAEFVKKLQRSGQCVAFVGDGINDAPALTQADLGIAVSRASDIAREAADIILLRSEITGVPEALSLARATLRTIKQNLFWAFFYNSLGVPLAALGFVSPIFCAAAMGASDLIVIGNALLLLRRRKPLV